MKKNRKRVAAYGLAAAAVFGGASAGMIFGPVSAMAENGTTATTSAPAAAAADSTATNANSSSSTNTNAGTSTNSNASAGNSTSPRPARAAMARANHVGAAATALGMSETDLKAELQAGKSMAQVATEKGVELQKVIDAIVTAHTKAIDQAVTDGKLTQAQADAKKANLTAHVTEAVNRTGMRGPEGKGGRGPGGPGGVARAEAASAAAGALGMSEADLKTERFQAGKTIAQVATEKGVELQKVIDAIVTAETKAIDQAVTDGKLTQAEADAKKANLTARVTEQVNQVGFCAGGHGGGPGGGRGGRGGPRGAAPADGATPPAQAPAESPAPSNSAT